MKSFFESVLKHLDRLDAAKLRDQYKLVTNELSIFEQVFEAMNDAIIVYDQLGEVLYKNPAAKALPDFNLPLGKTTKSEFAVTYPETHTYEAKTIPFDRGTLVIIHDTTGEKARSEAELQAGATKAVRDLAAGVAHEIGNPLNAIALNIQMLERDPTDRESIDIIKTQVKRLDGIIRSFLDALRDTKPNLMPGSLADPLKNCLTAMKPQFEERNLGVVLDIPAALPTVALDKDKIEQVFFNLVKNALEAVKDGTKLTITVSANDQEVSVAFTDEGAGMSNEQLTHLFEPYRTTKEKGTGLGLMISKRIITDHGGTISAESTLGKGTTFTVKLPRLEKRVRQLNG